MFTITKGFFWTDLRTWTWIGLVVATAALPPCCVWGWPCQGHNGGGEQVQWRWRTTLHGSFCACVLQTLWLPLLSKFTMLFVDVGSKHECVWLVFLVCYYCYDRPKHHCTVYQVSTNGCLTDMVGLLTERFFWNPCKIKYPTHHMFTTLGLHHYRGDELINQPWDPREPKVSLLSCSISRERYITAKYPRWFFTYDVLSWWAAYS